jgi:hypothetical protein
MQDVIDYLQITKHIDDNCEWTDINVFYDETHTIDLFAKIIANIVAEIRFGKESAHFDWWREKIAGTRRFSPKELEIIKAYLKPSFGTSEHPLPMNQVEAVVAETLWYHITKNTETVSGIPIRIEEPHFTVTEPGGDGLAVYDDGGCTYFYRLWEIKKHSTDTSSTTKITQAAKQLNVKGLEYLVKLSKIDQELDYSHPGLSEFYAGLVEKWYDGAEDSKAGISVSKKLASQITQTPITQAKPHLPNHGRANQLEAMIISIPDLSSLATKVREVIWSAI